MVLEEASCTHVLLPLLQQRIHGLGPGHENLNDHHELRYDLTLLSLSRLPAP